MTYAIWGPVVAQPKPKPRGPKPRKRIRGLSPSRYGSYRAKVKYANDLWRRLIYAKEPSGICPACFKRKWIAAAHGFVKGRYPHVRFELSNGIPLCGPCHRRVDYDHEAKVELWTAYVGPDEYERLRLLARSRGKMDLDLTIMLLEMETRDRGIR